MKKALARLLRSGADRLDPTPAPKATEGVCFTKKTPWLETSGSCSITKTPPWLRDGVTLS